MASNIAGLAAQDRSACGGGAHTGEPQILCRHVNQHCDEGVFVHACWSSKSNEVGHGKAAAMVFTAASMYLLTACGAQVLFLNSAVDAMDPLMEEWPLTLQLHRSKDAVTRMTLLSEEVLNVNITPSAFR
jgi:hypothetical protein